MNKLEELIYLSIGRASMCWSEIPGGKPNDEYAKQIAEELIAAIRVHVSEEIKKDRAVQRLTTLHVVKDANGNVIAQMKGSL